MNKKSLFYISIALSFIMLFFSLRFFAGIFNELIEVTAFEIVFEPEKGLVPFFYGLLTTSLLGIILTVYHIIIFVSLCKSSKKIIPLNSLLRTKNPYLKCIFILILVFSILGFYWINTRDNDIFYYLPFFILFPLYTYILLNFTTTIYKKS